jgi:glycosyltransferase involved in cell wall biosynthesis
MKTVQALGWYFPESLGGTEIYVAGLAARLRDAGHEVAIAAPDPGASDERSYLHDGIEVYRYPTPRDPTRDETGGTATVRGADRFHQWLEARRPDVLHLHSFTTGLGLPELRAGRRAGARLVATSHESRLGHLCQRGTLMRFGELPCDGIVATGKCAACALESRGLPRELATALSLVPLTVAELAIGLPGKLGTALGMRAVIARNSAMQLELLTLLDRFVLLTHHALETVRNNGAPSGKLLLNRLGAGEAAPARKPLPLEKPTKTPLVIGYLGRFDPVKGVEVLVEAVRRTPRDLPIRIELRGPENGPAERALVQELRAHAENDRRITFAPAVPRGEVSEILRGYDLLCCPSLCFEGGPTVALESFAVGTPVIGSRIGGLAEIVDEKFGRLVPAGDASALARLFAEVAARPATVDEWRRALPAPRTMDDVARDYLALYRTLTPATAAA